MTVLAHSGSGYGWGGPLEPWEIHPTLVHFPIAFLLGAVVLDIYAWLRGRPPARVVRGLLLVGVLTGLLTAAAGLLAFFTLPGTHTEQAHDLMYWHLGVQAAALVLFAIAWGFWRNADGTSPPAGARLVALLGADLLLVGSALGGYIVYHGGAGIESKLMAPQLHEHGGEMRN